MSDFSDDFDSGAPDVAPVTVQAPGLPDLPAIDPNGSVFQMPSLPAPSIMGGVDFPGTNLPVLGQTQSAPRTVSQGGLLQPATPSFAAGASQAPDRAKGIGTALDAAGTTVDGTHSVIQQIGQFAAEGDPVLEGLKGVTTAITAPLAVGSGVADTVSDINHGVSPSAAILGNALRTTAVFGAGALGEMLGGPLGAAGASYLAGKYMPEGAAIGNGLMSAFHRPSG